MRRINRALLQQLFSSIHSSVDLLKLSSWDRVICNTRYFHYPREIVQRSMPIIGEAVLFIFLPLSKFSLFFSLYFSSDNFELMLQQLFR